MNLYVNVGCCFVCVCVCVCVCVICCFWEGTIFHFVSVFTCFFDFDCVFMAMRVGVKRSIVVKAFIFCNSSNIKIKLCMDIKLYITCILRQHWFLFVFLCIFLTKLSLERC